MKKFVYLFIGIFIVFFLSACQNQAEQAEDNKEPKMLTFKVGNAPSEKTDLHKVSVEVVPEEHSGIKLTKEDFISNIKTVCLQVFVEGDYKPVYGKCSPVIDGKYPEIEVDSGKLPETEFKAKLVGYKYKTTYWKNLNRGSMLAYTNTKIFDSLLVLLGLQEVYMGDLNPSDSIYLGFGIIDSYKNIDFNNFTKAYIISNTGDIQEYSLGYKSENYTYSEFWFDKNEEYKFFCLDNTCFKMTSDLDIFNEEIDVSSMEESEMIPIDLGNTCSIKYNQYFHKEIDVSSMEIYNFEHYLAIDDCNQSRYKSTFVFTEYKELDIEFSGHIARYDINGTSLTIRTSQDEIKSYLYVKYIPNRNVEGVIFSPTVSINIIDIETNEIEQKVDFDLTTFEYINQ